MKKSTITKIRKLMITGGTAAVALLLLSCPQPLTEEDVIAAQDKLAPFIEVYSPGENEIYFSEVEFSLLIRDDAEAEADGRGDLASISFDVSNDDHRGGRAVINPDGTITQDSSFGPDAISYDAETGLVEFSFSTVAPSILDGLISVTVTALDRNGNQTEKRLSLDENEGPWVEFNLVDKQTGDERLFLENRVLSLSGSLGNSPDDKDKDNQIVSIGWSVTGKAWSCELLLDQSATYVDTYSKNTLPYYISSTGRYERLNEGFQYPELFIYDPSSRTFSTEILIPYGVGSVLPFEITVVDKNGHETVEVVNAFSNEAGPEVGIDTPSPTQSVYYSWDERSSAGHSDAIEGYITGGISDLAYFGYIIEDSVGKNSGNDPIELDINTVFTDNRFSFKPDFNEMDIASTGGQMSVTIVAINDQNNQTRPVIKMYEDSTPPSISVSSFTATANTANSGYARNDSTLELSINVSENISLLKSDEIDLEYTIGGYTLPVTGNIGTGNQTIVPAGTWSSGLVSDANIKYEITLTDRLGNSETYVSEIDGSKVVIAAAPQVMHYPGIPGVTELIIESETAPKNWAVSGENVYIDITSSRKLNQLMNSSIDSSYDPSVSTVGETGFRISMNRTDNDITADFIDFQFDIEDLAGNTKTLTVSGGANEIDPSDDNISALTSGSGVIFDSKKPDLSGVVTQLSGLTGGLFLNNTSAGSSILTITGVENSDVSFASFDYDVKAENATVLAVETNRGTDLDAAESKTLTSPSPSEDGNLILNVTVRDEAGNTESITNRGSAGEWVVLDMTPPTIGNMIFTDDGAPSDRYAKSGDTLTLTMDLSDATSHLSDTSSVTILSTLKTGVTDNSPGYTYTVTSGTTGASHNSNIPYSIVIKDKAGNSTSKSNSSVDPDAENIRYYGTFPLSDLTTRTFESENANPLFATSGNDIDLNLISSRKIQKPGSLGTPGSYVIVTGKEITLDAGETTVTAGVERTTADVAGETVTLSIPLLDKAGNPLTVSHSDLTTSPVTYDSKAPLSTNVTFGITGTASPSYINNSETTAAKLGITIPDAVNWETELDKNFKEFEYTLSDTNSTPEEMATGTSVVSVSNLSLDYSDVVDGDLSLSGILRDEAGNETPFGDATLIMLDRVAPKIENFSFTDDGAPSNKYAMLGDELTLSMDLSDATSHLSNTSTVTIQGATMTGVTDDSTGYTYSVKRDATVVTHNNNIPYNIVIKDKAGNSTPMSYETDNSGDPDSENIRYYGTFPLSDLTTRTFESENANPLFATSGNDIDLNLISSRKIQKPGSLGTPGSYVIVTGKEITLDAGETTVTAGVERTTADVAGETVTLSIPLLDKAGNPLTVSHSDLTTSPVTYDSKAPLSTNVTFGITGTASPSYINNSETTAAKLGITIPDAVNWETELDKNFKEFEYTLSDTNSTPEEMATGTSVVSVSNLSLDYSDVVDGDLSLSGILRDEAGNETPFGDATLIMLDRVAPKIENFSFTDDGAPSNKYAMLGDELTLSMDLSDATSHLSNTSTVTIQGATMTGVTDDSTGYTYSVKRDATVVTHNNNIPYNIVIKDKAGNSTPMSYETDNSGDPDSENIRYYGTFPLSDLTTRTFESENANPLFATSGNDINLNLVSSRKIQKPGSLGTPGSYAIVTGKEITLDAGETTVTAGVERTTADVAGETVTLSIPLLDKAGNPLTVLHSNLTTSPVTYDSRNPVLDVRINDVDGNVNIILSGQANDYSNYLNAEIKEIDGDSEDDGILTITLDDAATTIDENFKEYTIKLRSVDEPSDDIWISPDVSATEYTDASPLILYLDSSYLSTFYEGDYELQVSAYDQAGNPASSTWQTLFHLDTEAPSFIPEDGGTVGVESMDLSGNKLTLIFSEPLHADIVNELASPVDLSLKGFSISEDDGNDNPLDNNADISASIVGNNIEISLFVSNLLVTPRDFTKAKYYILDFTNDFMDLAGNQAVRTGGTLTRRKFEIQDDNANSDSLKDGSITDTGLKFVNPVEVVKNIDPVKTDRIISDSNFIESVPGKITTPDLSTVSEPTITPTAYTIPVERTLQIDERKLRAQEKLLEPESAPPVKPAVAEEPVPPELIPATAMLPARRQTGIDREALLFMEQVERNRQDYKAVLKSIQKRPVTSAQLKAMEAVLEPVIPAVEELTVYASPFPTAFEDAVVINADESLVIVDEQPTFMYLLLQLAGYLLIGLTVLLFLWTMKKIQGRKS